MSIKPFIPKINQELPDHYGVTIHHIDGTSQEFEVASHDYNGTLFEIATKDDLMIWIPMENVKRVEFDKRFSKIIAIKRKMRADEMATKEEKQRVAAKN